MRIAIAQINTIVGDLWGNKKKILEFVKKAKQKDADIVVFPEMTVCGYPPEDLLYKEHFIQDNLGAVKSLASKIKGIAAVVGFVDRGKNGKLFNSAAVISHGKICGSYRKKHLPNYGVFDEKRYFSAGKKDFLFKLGATVFAVNICEDLWAEDKSFDRKVRAGVDVIFNLSGSPYDLGKLGQRENLLTKTAHKNKVFICYANLVGGQDELVFDGCSLVADSQGKIFAAGQQFEEDLVVVDLDIKPKRKKASASTVKIKAPEDRRKKKKPIKKHFSRRLNAVERIYKALVLGTRDYVKKNGFKKVVVGLSGGIDSSLVAAIARDAIGKKNVIGVSMPSKYTSQGTRSDAVRLADTLGIKLIKVPIDEIFGSYTQTLKKEFEGLKFDVTEENIQARIRGNILMAFSNKFGWLVLTTGNKSEVAVGYCTLYGDLSGGFAVIKDVPKTMVYDLARFINQGKKKVIPESILKRAPSAELREGQKDQDSLPPYEELDALLKAYVEDYQSLSQMKGINPNTKLTREVIDLIDKSEYKRRQSPPGIKITPRAFGKDWRLPITNRYKEF